ncbi:two-component response regulator (plasmid) [[Synechococcus] sp. NIES-970]|uniref:response regulator transcription factor n=1 Tax=Picosynechococcus sp. NKBG15041c TaxID=1407650 RepID=UPI0004033408|nr:response regulator transcription factor [Picosynechococcus sp. NKBG15041c]BAW97872.1 two-component response regulator [[Synechococcus] sp. NIES-970]
MPHQILIAEDDRKLAALISSELILEGYNVTIAHNGIDALNFVRENNYDLLIFDWLMPGLSGIDLCLRLRSSSIELPIILLTAKDEISDRVSGLNAGADDYVTKPFSIEELLARVNAHLRRARREIVDQLEFEDLTLNGITREVYRAQHLIQLTAKEFDLLELLMRHPRQVLTREQILEKVWGYDFIGESNVIEVYIRALRLKLESHNIKRIIHTVRSIGYVLKSD